ncbi:MAG: hypothetical protein JJ863_37230 [Deltaproteobacteria bacterium]|nr:hypothetical protein [Deltaproteobacteria bacterium]
MFVYCGGRGAAHRDDADALRRRFEQRAMVSSCMAPPPELELEVREGYCEEQRCVLDAIAFAQLRACETDDDCTRITDPCGPPLGVLASKQSEAEARVQSAERARRCGGHPAVDAAAPPGCVRGWCR